MYLAAPLQRGDLDARGLAWRVQPPDQEAATVMELLQGHALLPVLQDPLHLKGVAVVDGSKLFHDMHMHKRSVNLFKEPLCIFE